MTTSYRIVMEYLRRFLRVIESIWACPAGLVGLSSAPPSKHSLSSSSSRSIRHFEHEIKSLFTGHLTDATLLLLSNHLQRDFRDKLLASQDCMLPSFNHTLPSGHETGTFLVLDIGGSTFRGALVSLSGREQGKDAMRIVRSTSTVIDEKIRSLHGTEFFDWIASRIKETLREGPETSTHNGAIPMGLSWSFPVEQTSTRSWKVKNMGKGFHCHRGILGQDLGDIITAACAKQDINVRIDAVINDSSATLLTRAYLDPATSMSLILGTGTNAAVYLPVSRVGSEKFGQRDASWHSIANSVIVNTELSMFGGNVLPRTRWDDQLNRSHVLPDFQPLEYMCTGRYLGEIVRLIMLEAARTSDLFGGRIPSSMSTPYSLDTAFLAILESDNTPNLSRALSYLEKTHNFTDLPSHDDLTFLRNVAQYVSSRSAAYLAVGVHALWALDRPQPEPHILSSMDIDKTTIACDGSVINKYPGFRDLCQNHIASMITTASHTENNGSVSTNILPQIHLEPVNEAGILGAAVAVAICENDESSSS